MKPSHEQHVAVLAVCSALVALAPPAIAAPVDVVARTPNVACPGEVEVQKALSAQVGDGAPAHGWRLVYRSSEDNPATGVQGRRALQLELADERGQSRLRRQLRVEGGDCHAQAEAIALIVYRFFAQLGSASNASLPASPPPVEAPFSSPSALSPAPLSPPASPPSPLPPAWPPLPSSRPLAPAPARASPPPPAPALAVASPPTPASSPASSPSSSPSARPPAVQKALAPARAPTRLQLSLEAGVGLWTRRPGTGTGVFGVRVGFANFEAGFSVLAPRAPTAERSADGGDVEVSALGMAVSLGLGWQRGRLRLHGGPLAIVSRESARSSGIAIPAENTGTTAALGLGAGGSWPLWHAFDVGFEAGLGHAVFGNRFVVAGWGPVLAPPTWQGVVLARLGYTFSR